MRSHRTYDELKECCPLCLKVLRRVGPEQVARITLDTSVEKTEALRYQGISCRLRKNFPVNSCGASSANQTAVSAPSSTERVAFGPPMSVRTHPGHIALTAMWSARSASASMTVRPLSASFDRQ